jgi:hypothetical protein
VRRRIGARNIGCYGPSDHDLSSSALIAYGQNGAALALRGGGQNHELRVSKLGHGSLLGVARRNITALPPPTAPPVNRSGHRAGGGHQVNSRPQQRSLWQGSPMLSDRNCQYECVCQRLRWADWQALVLSRNQSCDTQALLRRSIHCRTTLLMPS